MAAALAVTPASGSVINTVSLVRVDVTGADPAQRQRIRATKGGITYLVSHEFQPSTDGNHSWFNITIPSSGTWVLQLYPTASSGTTLAALSVTVS
jgi:hypothetical protein